jgi:hypothetical protein
LTQINRRHLDACRHRQRRVTPQQRPHRLRAQRPLPGQQLRQGRLDRRLPFLRRQVQQPHVLLVGTAWLLCQQGVVALAKRQRRIQIFAVHVARERPRLLHQPTADMPIIDAMLRLAAQPFHHLHHGAAVAHGDRLGAEPDLHHLAN